MLDLELLVVQGFKASFAAEKNGHVASSKELATRVVRPPGPPGLTGSRLGL